MKLTELELAGAFLINLEPIEDERGFFARSFCREEFAARGLNAAVAQCSISFNRQRGTLRGLHYQAPPKAETKLVRCTQGCVYDVIVDLRAGSPTYRQWTAVELTAENHRMLYIPEGLAHGFQTLRDDTELFYQMSQFYDPGSARGLRWDDPAFRMHWPLPITAISEKDESYPPFDSGGAMQESGNLVAEAVSSLPECGRIPHVGPAGNAGPERLAERQAEFFRPPAVRVPAARDGDQILVRCPISETPPASGRT